MVCLSATNIPFLSHWRQDKDFLLYYRSAFFRYSSTLITVFSDFDFRPGLAFESPSGETEMVSSPKSRTASKQRPKITIPQTMGCSSGQRLSVTSTKVHYCTYEMILIMFAHHFKPTTSMQPPESNSLTQSGSLSERLRSQHHQAWGVLSAESNRLYTDSSIHFS